MSKQIEGIQDYWAENKLCFSSLPKEDAQDLLKVMVFHDIADRWETGFVHLAKLELLTRAFPEDGLLIEIYNQLHARCNDAVTQITEKNYNTVMSHCFQDQPETYTHHGEGYSHWYNVNDDEILKKLIAKHPLLEGAIKGVVYR